MKNENENKLFGWGDLVPIACCVGAAALLFVAVAGEITKDTLFGDVDGEKTAREVVGAVEQDPQWAAWTNGTSIVIGNGAYRNVYAGNSVVLGVKAHAGGGGNQGPEISIGYGAWARGREAVAIGSGAQAENYGVSIGGHANGGILSGDDYLYRAGMYSISLGYDARATNDNAIAIGSWTTEASGAWSTAIGQEAFASGHYSTALGNASSTYEHGIAIGSYNRASSCATNSIAFGFDPDRFYLSAYYDFSAHKYKHQTLEDYVAGKIDEKTEKIDEKKQNRYTFEYIDRIPQIDDPIYEESEDGSLNVVGVITHYYLHVEDSTLYNVTAGTNGFTVFLPYIKKYVQDCVLRIVAEDAQNGTQFAGVADSYGYDIGIEWQTGDLRETGSLKGTNYVTFTQVGTNLWSVSHVSANRGK